MMVSQEFGHVCEMSKKGNLEQIIQTTCEKGKVTVPTTVAKKQIPTTNSAPKEKIFNGDLNGFKQSL